MQALAICQDLCWKQLYLYICGVKINSTNIKIITEGSKTITYLVYGSVRKYKDFRKTFEMKYKPDDIIVKYLSTERPLKNQRNVIFLAAILFRNRYDLSY